MRTHLWKCKKFQISVIVTNIICEKCYYWEILRYENIFLLKILVILKKHPMTRELKKSSFFFPLLSHGTNGLHVAPSYIADDKLWFVCNAGDFFVDCISAF